MFRRDNNNNNNNNDKKKKINNSKKPRHFWHLVNPSPWPFVTSFSLFNTIMSVILYLAGVEAGANMMFLGFILVLLSILFWFQEIIEETKFNGTLTNEVLKSLRIGMLLFIASEVMFFFAFFWAYYHFGLSPAFNIGSSWPPRSIQVFNPYSIPLLNTFILLLSGVFATWTHRELLLNEKIFYERMINQNDNEIWWNLYTIKRRFDGAFSLFVTIILAIIFTGCQLREYITASFHIADSTYGCVFFMATGFHGFHVIIGTLFLFTCFLRLIFFHYTETSHSSLEFAIWYWHFVDVVWLFLFISVYWWPV